MTRRSAILASALVCGAYVGVKGQISSTGNVWSPRGPLTFDLDTFTAYHFTLGGLTVTFTPAEIMAALKGTP